MNNTQLKYTLLGLYVAILLIFIIGILTANIYLFVASTVLLVFALPILLKHPNLIEFPKKLNIGSEVAFEKTFYITNIIMFYSAIAIITLRKTYPHYEIVGYVLLLVIFMNAIIFKIIQKNIEKKYLM